MHPLLCVYGTRPEAIKVAPVVLCARSLGLDVSVCVTGQHRNLLDDVNRLFGIVPDFDLDLLRPNQSPEELLARAIVPLRAVYHRVEPAAVVVQGDTTTTVAAALAAFYAGIPVAHVEAGLRTGDLGAPFPEELHRQLVGRMARWHFAPTRRAAESLAAEGITRSVHVTGNTGLDAVHHIRARQPEDRALLAELGLGQDDARWVLVTAHRRESIGAPFARICEGIRALAERNRDLRFLFSLHPNPNFRTVAEAQLDHPRIRTVPPLSFTRLLSVLGRVWLVMTDSGGLQEEAPELGKPVLVLREETDRPEAVEAGLARLVGRDPARMAAAVEELRDPSVYARMSRGPNPFGDGHAAERIVAQIAEDLGLSATWNAVRQASA